jgi:hypothetical protein
VLGVEAKQSFPFEVEPPEAGEDSPRAFSFRWNGAR